ncbi:phosphoenolpyruvate carboxylase [Magnetovibrio sp. PR-2]|uniref:phosphoenolpyruvate carboxylase n=1 Tax=Magnetovibrio sp. PR-2 TaxID=3120356 RepID=UPI002FCDEA74
MPDTPQNDAFRGAEHKILPRACHLRDELADKLQQFQREARENHLQSPIRRMALYVSCLRQSGDVSTGGFSDLVRLLTLSAFKYRAQRLRDYVGELDVDKNEQLLHDLFEGLTQDDGAKADFDVFKSRVEREVFGVVFTAHPTFTVSQDLTEAEAALAVECNPDGSKLSEAEFDALVKSIAEKPHGTPDQIGLADEQKFATMAIGNIHLALRRVYRVVFAVAQKHYPYQWLTLTPKLLSVASWVGYDLDGRADIGWSDTLFMRMSVERLALESYLDSLDGVSGVDDARAMLRTALVQLDGDLERLALNPNSIDEVGAFSRALAEGVEDRLVSIAGVTDVLTDTIEAGGEHAVDLAVLRAEMANFGLAFAQTHMRINATQLTNAIRHNIDITTMPEDPANRRRYLVEIASLLQNVKPVSVNFGTIMNERATAKRVFMLVAKFLTYVDQDEPVRFLIAECNTPFTVLTALYFAKLFGVDDKIDISPLFETGFALDQGHEIVTELLKNPTYVDYVKGRGRICIQTGFSDAGRYIGQVPASLAIERIRIKLAKRIKASGVEGVSLLIFDTHGESIGRGAHPLSFADRLDYTYPPQARAKFQAAGIHVKQEVSFQGGDGYVYFAHPNLAFATVCRLLEHALTRKTKPVSADVFYEDTDYSLDYFMTVTGFNERLMENPNYAATLNLFGTNLLYPTGSRKVKRQHEGGAQVDLEHPSQVRAIPHNAILQQLGYFSNTISGHGKAIAKDQDRFAEVFQLSDRCRRFTAMVAYARHLSNLDALHGYVSLFDPAIWLRRAAIEENPERAEQMQTLADLLRHSSRHEKVNRVYRIFLNDTLYLDRGLKAVGADEMLPTLVDDCYPDLLLLHAVRIALIHEMFLLAARLPKFSDRQVSSSDETIQALLNLDVEHALNVLRNAFPVSGADTDAKAFGEEATYRTDAEHGYEKEHRELFAPLEELYDMTRRISIAVAHISGAVG